MNPMLRLEGNLEKQFVSCDNLVPGRDQLYFWEHLSLFFCQVVFLGDFLISYPILFVQNVISSNKKLYIFVLRLLSENGVRGKC